MYKIVFLKKIPFIKITLLNICLTQIKYPKIPVVSPMLKLTLSLV